MNRRMKVSTVFAAALVGAPWTAAFGADYTPAERGIGHYRIFCSNCHGPEGQGDGVLVPMLNIKPQDLTLLARQAGGNFDAERIFKAIDGRHQVTGGGERKMPVFSDNLEVSTIIELVEYLRIIQK